MGIKHTNFAVAKLASSVTAGQATPFTFTVQTGKGSLFDPLSTPGDYLYAVFRKATGEREIMKVTARSGDVMTVTERAVDGTTAQNWSTNDIVANDFTKSGLAILFSAREDLDAHLVDATDAHDASAISVTPIAGVDGDDVQEALSGLKAYSDAGDAARLSRTGGEMTGMLSLAPGLPSDPNAAVPLSVVQALIRDAQAKPFLGKPELVTANRRITNADKGKVLECALTADITLTFDLPGAFDTDWFCWINNTSDTYTANLVLTGGAGMIGPQAASPPMDALPWPNPPGSDGNATSILLAAKQSVLGNNSGFRVLATATNVDPYVTSNFRFPTLCGAFPYRFGAVIGKDGWPRLWGANANGQLGQNHTTSPVHTPVPISLNVPVPSDTTLVDLVVCGMSCYAVFSNGWVYSWGANAAGQLGHGDTTQRNVATRIEYFVTNAIPVVKVSGWGFIRSSSGLAFFLGSNGNLYACGANTSGQLGVGNTTQQNTPTLVAGITGGTAQDVFPGGLSTFCKAGGNLYGTGLGSYVGAGDAAQKTSFTATSGLPTIVPGSVEIAKVRNTCDRVSGVCAVLMTTGELYVTGYNGVGNLGLGDTTTPRTAFVKVANMDSGAGSVAIGTVTDFEIAEGNSGFGHMMAVIGGDLYTCGSNVNGNTGQGTTSGNQTLLKRVSAAFNGNIAKIHMTQGVNYMPSPFVLDNSGDLWNCGQNVAGSLHLCRQNDLASGIKSTWAKVMLPRFFSGERITDIQAAGDTNASTFSVAWVFILTSRGRIFGIGYNGDGQVGAYAYGSPPSTVATYNPIDINYQ